MTGTPDMRTSGDRASPVRSAGSRARPPSWHLMESPWDSAQAATGPGHVEAAGGVLREEPVGCVLCALRTLTSEPSSGASKRSAVQRNISTTDVLGAAGCRGVADNGRLQ